MPWIAATLLDPDDDTHYPVLRIDVEIGGISRPHLSIVDSGSDVSLIPAELLVEFPGVDYFELENPEDDNQGAGGAFETRLCPGSLSWRGVSFCGQLRIAEPGVLPNALLGRDDFFSTFEVQFRWDHGVFYVDPFEGQVAD